MTFGSFSGLCTRAPIPICSVVGSTSTIVGSSGIEASCYARNIGLANTIIFQGAASFIHIVALLMDVIMILHIRSKFTAIGMLHSTSFLWKPETGSFSILMLTSY